jgi:hypothetical protein
MQDAELFLSCSHALKRAPDLLIDAKGNNVLLSECIVCGCGIGFELDEDGATVRRWLVLPPSRKAA